MFFSFSDAIEFILGEKASLVPPAMIVLTNDGGPRLDDGNSIVNEY